MSKRIPVSAPQSGLQSPFAGLEIANLPPGQDVPKAPTPQEVKQATRTHRVVIRREKAQRGGKTVVVVSQLPTHLSIPELESLLKSARKALGCGGTLQGREMELQGDQPDRVRAWLEDHNFKVAGP